jgi:hypothetical protein
MTEVAAKQHFEVSAEGLRQILERKDKSFIVTELVQNSWDEDATRVDVTLVQDPDQPGVVHLTVEDDDPEGFTNITHAYTLFAASEKKSDATKRGRFNLGEKLVIAACLRSEISTTTGRIVFDLDGRREYPADRTAGSKFTGTLMMTDEEYGVVVRVVSTLIPPPDKITTFNGEQLAVRTPVRTFEEKVWTEIAGEDGKMKRTIRKTTVELYDPLPGEEATVYEMGVPVVEADCRWHVNVMQKVPLSIERDNLTPAWLRDIRRIVLNHAHDLLTAADGDASWILDGMADEEVSPEVLEHAIELRFGKAVAYDPSDPEANRLAAADGYSTLTSNALPKEVWKNVKQHGVLLPAGRVTPSVKPYEPGQERTRRERPIEEWTHGMQQMAGFARSLADALLGVALDVAIVDDSTVMNFEVNYRKADSHQAAALLELNLRRLGHRWFEGDPASRLDQLLYALAHHFETDRLSARFHQSVASLARDSFLLALRDPRRFDEYRPETVKS